MTLPLSASQLTQLLNTPISVSVALPLAALAPIAPQYVAAGPSGPISTPSKVAEPGTFRSRLAKVAAPGCAARTIAPSGIVRLPWPSLVSLYTPSARMKVVPAGARLSAVPSERHGAAAVHGLVSAPLTTSKKSALPVATATDEVLVTEPAGFAAVSVKVVFAATATDLLVKPLTSPTPLSIVSAVAPADAQVSVTLPPPSGSVAGVAMKLVIVGAVAAATATTVEAVTEPAAFVAVSVKVVPAVTVTVRLVLALTSPTPGSMVSWLASLTVQVS